GRRGRSGSAAATTRPDSTRAEGDVEGPPVASLPRLALASTSGGSPSLPRMPRGRAKGLAVSLPGAQDHAVLIRQKHRLAGETEPCSARVPEERLPCDAALHRRADRRLPAMEIDVHESAAGPEQSPESPQVPRPAQEMVVRVHDQHEITRALRQKRIV